MSSGYQADQENREWRASQVAWKIEDLHRALHLGEPNNIEHHRWVLAQKLADLARYK